MEYLETEEYLLLHFKERVDHKFFTKPNLFFKIVNFESKNPFIQIGNHVFSAKFDDEFLGTSLIFEEQDELRPREVYQLDTDIHLEYVGKATKALILQWYKVPDEIVNIDESELVDLEFTNTYETVLKQIENQSLDIKDIIKKPGSKAIPVIQQKATKDNNLDSPKNTLPIGIKTSEPKETDPVESSLNDSNSTYKLLKDFVQKPKQDPQYYEQLDDDTFRTDKEYKILKEILLKSIDYNQIKPKVKMQSWSQMIDIDASMKSGIVEKKEWSLLDENDLKKMISLENFDNLSEEMKLVILMDYLKEEKEVIKNMTRIELAQEDDFGRTPKKRYKLVKSLAKDLKYNMFLKSLKLS